MAISKNMKKALENVDLNKVYSLEEAATLVKDNSRVKFDATVDLAVRLGVDPRQANQMVRGVVSLPHGTGKDLKVLALVTADKEEDAKSAGADYVGLDEYIEKIKNGWTDIDVIVRMPAIMGKIGALGKVLGPRGLMPNPKSGTVTMDIAKAVSEYPCFVVFNQLTNWPQWFFSLHRPKKRNVYSFICFFFLVIFNNH